MGVRTRLATVLIATVVTSTVATGLAVAPLVGAREVDPSPGAPTAGDSVYPRFGNGGYDATHYGIRLRWKPATSRIVASTVVRARARKALSSYSLDFEGLRLRAVTVDGRAAEWRRNGHKVRVTPRRFIATGEVFRTRFVYAGVPRRHRDPDGSYEGWFRTNDGVVALGQPVGSLTWFPNNDTPRDKATFDVRVNVPRALEVAGNGSLVGRRTSQGRTTWHWRSGRPMAPFLAMVGIGQYDVFRSRTRDGIGVLTFADPTLPSTHNARRNLPRMLTWLQKRYGRYPFATSGMVVDRYSAGYALETQTRPVFPFRADPLTLVHELAHQWFGDSVSPSDWNHIWLSEGYATYNEWLWQAHRGGRTPHRIFETEYARHGEGSDFWSVPPANPDIPENLFAEGIYTRGAMTLQVLRERIGADDFSRLSRQWARTRAYGIGSTRQFTALAERVSGQDLDTLFEDWLYADSRPRGY